MREKICCIYKITNPRGSMYVGQTVDLYLREIQYRKGHAYKQKKLFASFIKYGYENHTLEVIEYCTREVLNEREKYWIDKLDTYVNGMNLTTGGDSKYSLSDEARKRLSESKIGDKNPMYGRASWSKGLKMSAEYKKRLSEAHLGKFRGKENGFWKGYVHVYKDGKYFASYEGSGEAARALKTDPSNINAVINGKRNHHLGFTFIRSYEETPPN